MSDDKPAEKPAESVGSLAADTAEAEAVSEHTSLTSSQYTGTQINVKRRWFRIIFMAFGGAVVGLVGLVTFTLVMEGKEGILGSGTPAQKLEPQLSATEILAQEFSGKIETAPVDPESLTQPPNAELPTTAEMESRDFDDAVKEMFGDDEKKNEKKDAKKKDDKSPRKPAAVDKSPLKLKFDKGASKVSKNLDKGKVLSLLAKKLDNSCQPKLPDNTKSVKAEIKVAKNGSIANIKVTPSSAESELAKCMRKKLADTKVLKPKDKSVAQITVQFKTK